MEVRAFFAGIPPRDLSPLLLQRPASCGWGSPKEFIRVAIKRCPSPRMAKHTAGCFQRRYPIDDDWIANF